MDKLLEEQRQISESLEKAWTNFKKDATSRKTPDYKATKLGKLKEIWAKFVLNDEQIKLLAGSKNIENIYSPKTTEDIYATYKNALMLIPDVILEDKNENKLNDEELKLIKSQMTRFSSLQRALDDVRDAISNGDQLAVSVAKIRAKNIETIWERISIQHENISSSIRTFPTSYQTQIMQLEKDIEECLIYLQERSSAPENKNMDGTIKLQRITIPKFNGDYFKWTSFRDLFTSMVINNRSLTMAQRMQVLKTNLEGEAEALISDLTIADVNFTCAWKRLVDRYENTRVIVNKYLNKLLSQTGGRNDATAVRNLLDTTDQTMLALQNLGRPTEHWDDWVVFLTTKKLADDLRKDWEKKIGETANPPTWTELKTFLEHEFRMLETLETNKKTKDNKSQIKSLHAGVNQSKCPACTKGHKLFSCIKFRKMETPERWELAKKQKLCFTCLQKHTDKLNCERKQPCKKCDSSKHSTWLHDDRRTKKVPEKSVNAEPSTDEKVACHISVIGKTEPETNMYAATIPNFQEKLVLLATAVILVQDGYGRRLAFRALLDSGSQGSMITAKAAALLNIPLKNTSKIIYGIGGAKSKKVKMLNITIHPRFDSTYELDAQCYVLNTLTQIMPDKDVDKSSWGHLRLLKLADPNFNKMASIDILFGTDVLSEILMQGLVKDGPGKPIAQETKFGWIISGNIESTRKHKVTINHTSSEEDVLNLSKFWELEELAVKREWTVDEEKCEELYKTGVTKDNSGKYIVKIPFKDGEEGPESLGESKRQCMARFLQLERKLKNNVELKNEYTKVMNEYIYLGHMKLISNNPEIRRRYYIPHHAVLKPDSLTTKTRIVFDASAKSTSGKSLNDCMYVGAKQQKDLMEHLLSWRLKKIVFKADITKMYRQIGINKEDQEYHTILWRDESTKDIQEYQLTTVTFGTAAAPFLATRTLNQIASDSKEQFPKAAELILNNFYIDDLIAGQDNVQEAINVKNELILALGANNFELVKWSSNSEEFLNSLPSEITEKSLQVFSHLEETTKALGLQWHPKSDKFSFTLKMTIDDERITKRRLLSESSKLFDPLGWLSPVIIAVKLLMQQTWLTKIGWDDEVAGPISSRWIQIRNELHLIEKLKINRWIKYGKGAKISLHGFADSSEKAYSAVVYSRVETKEHIETQLLVAKTRVAPIKTQTTIPRLELCGAVLVAKLLKATREALQMDDISTTAWSDSMITLGWVNNSPNKWKTFVGNRVAEINAANIHTWKYVRSEDNPADCASRGLTPEQLLNHSLWWQGPEWLKKDSSIWPDQTIEDHSIEAKRISVNLIKIEENPIRKMVHQSSSWSKVTNIIAYCLRIKREGTNRTKYLGVDEINKAKTILYKFCQQESFAAELHDLRKYGKVSNKSKLQSLTPFLDENGLIRVGGRLRHAAISFNNKHPIILPHDHHITLLIIRQMHKDTLHGGPRLMMGLLQKKFWIIQSKKLSTNEYKQCTTCRRFRAKTRDQIMGDLPKERVTLDRVFKNTGIDYAGPIEVKSSKIRSARIQKGYIALFICLGTGAVHLELVSDQTTEAFLASLNRFIARRGLCTTIHSDNAKTFKGAAGKLKKEESEWWNGKTEEMAALMAPKGIKWKFIPPESPNFGGKWERNIRSMKDHLKKTIKNTRLTFEEYGTLLCQIEACLNSRPIGPLTADIDNLNVLTPGHFLIGEPLLAPPQPAWEDTHKNPVSRWNHIKMLQQHFWNRWSKEYLTQLQQRRKWQKNEPNLHENDVVLIKEDNLPPRNWLMGRIVKLYAGSDNKVRVVTVKTTNGELTRNIRKVCPLLESREEESNISQQKEPPSSTTEKPRRNPPRGSSLVKTSLVYILAFIYFMMTTTGGSSPGKKPLTIEEFKHQPGIFFEDLGRVSIVKTDWHMTVYYGLSEYMREYKAINSYTEDLQEICEKNRVHPGDEHHEDISKLLKEKISKIRTLNRLIIRDKQKRSAPLNIVGWAQHELFGVMDEEQAEHIETQITTLEGNEQHLLKLIKNQTTIIEASTDLMKITQDEINQNYGKIDKILRSIKNETDISQIREQTLSLALFIFMLADRYEAIQRTLVDTLTDVYHGRINSYLYTPQQFKEQLRTIKSNLPAGCKLPDIDQDDMKSFYKLMTAKAKVTGKYVLVDIIIPLVSTTEYQMLHIIPIPVEYEGQEIIMIPESEFLIISLKKKNFYQMNTNDIHTCTQTKIAARICRIRHTMYSSQSDKSQCERDFLQEKVNPRCKFKLVPKTDIWIPLQNKHNWLYRVHQKITMNILCDNNPSILSLEKSGIITIPAGCEVDIGSTTISVDSDKHSEGSYNIHPALNLSETMKKAENKLEDLNFTMDHNDQLREIHESLKNLKSHENLQKVHHTTHYGLSIITIMAVIIIIVTYGKLIYKRKMTSNTQTVSEPNMADSLSRSRAEGLTLQDQLTEFENDP